MLKSAVNRESESVYVDLLTYADLVSHACCLHPAAWQTNPTALQEMLKNRKQSSMGDVNTTSMSAASSSSAAAARHANKRYLIMTYAVEFDRVHYPLPMVHQPAPSPQALQRTVQRLRQELVQARSMAAAGGVDITDSSANGSALGGALARLQQENQALRTQVQRLRDSLGSAQGVDREMRNALTTAETARGKAEDALERLRNASRGEVKRLRGEVDALKQQLVHVHQAAEASSVAVTANAASDREELRSTNTKLRARVRDLLKQLSTHGIRPRGGNSVLGTPTRRAGGGKTGLGRVSGATGSRGRTRASPGRNSAGGSRAGSAASRGSRGRSPGGAARAAPQRASRNRTPSPVVSRRSTRYARPWLGGSSDAESVGSRGSRGSRASHASRASSAGSNASLKRRHSSGKYGYDPVAYAKARQEKIQAARQKRGMTPTRKDGRPGTGPSGGTRPGELPAYMRSPGGRSVGSAGSRASASSAFSTGSKRSAGKGVKGGTPSSRRKQSSTKDWDRPWRSSPKANAIAHRPGTKSGSVNKGGAGGSSSPLRPSSAVGPAPQPAPAEQGPGGQPWVVHPPQVQRRQAWAAQEQEQHAHPTGRRLQQPGMAKRDSPPVPPEEPYLAQGHGVTVAGGGLTHSASAHSFVGQSSEASFQPSVPVLSHAHSSSSLSSAQPAQGVPSSASYAYNPVAVGGQLPSDGSAEISAIDQRLQALQSFLKAAKTGQAGVNPPT